MIRRLVKNIGEGRALKGLLWGRVILLSIVLNTRLQRKNVQYQTPFKFRLQFISEILLVTKISLSISNTFAIFNLNGETKHFADFKIPSDRN